VANVLFLTQVLPFPLNSGAKIRAYYVLRQMAQQHAVTLVSFVRQDDPPEAIAHLRGLCSAVHTVPMRRSRLRDARALLKAGLTGRSVVIVRDEISGMFATLQRLAHTAPFDVIHADQTSMVQYALYAQRQHRKTCDPTPVHTVLDAHNALYRIPERLATVERNPLKRLGLRREARALRRFESRAYRQFDHVVFVTEVDRQELLALPVKGTATARRGEGEARAPATSVIPICVDPEAQPLVPRVSSPMSVVHVGTMFWPPNIEGVLWFARETFPRVLAQVPEAQFVIVGKNPPPAVQELPRAIPNISVTGYVPDPAPYLAQTAAFIVPLRAGGGMRVKIVDAWCWGVPIVSTTVGAEGIDVRNGENILIADTPEEMAAAVIRLLRDPGLGERLRRNGRTWVERHYNWRTVYPAWDRVYASVLSM